MTEELKPCPFCGAAPVSRATPTAQAFEGDAGAWSIWCENPDCPAQPEVMGETQEAAEGKWNERTPNPALIQARADADVAELRERLAAAKDDRKQMHEEWRKDWEALVALQKLAKERGIL